MKNDVLVIIDMQPQTFEAANKYTVKMVNRRIREAQQKDFTILLVEFANAAKTAPAILKQLRQGDYIKTTKNKNNGGRDIKEALDFVPDNFYFCGVNTLACVRDSIIGTKRFFKNSNYFMLTDACNSDCGCDRCSTDAGIRKEVPKYVKLKRDLL